MTPRARHAAATYARESFIVSKARACELMTLAVGSYYYQPTYSRPEQPLREALRRHAAIRRRWGVRLLFVLLRRDGFTDDHKRIHQLYCAEGLQVKRRRLR